eukprot:gnl/TRDRNA2_/TRDRNA2_173250_c1_seq3.p1 gnl/TRDRNA2_/TRDRNA2_173250_c1~~gnl/TRDRNA2_/TRDRNA2_173250_c1_seq3.p1  ORF type:complete len:334 (-),score=40.86 gnl/TRDRNA2_/TRDRNA2_173250_c1_seq3:61-1035(-)
MDHEGGISKLRIAERLADVLRHRGEVLSEEEVETFVNFCFSSLTDQKPTNPSGPQRSDSRWSPSAALASFRRSLGLRRYLVKPSNVQEDQRVNIDNFTIATSSLERIGFENIVKLFDRDRKLSFLERIFFPQALREYIFSAREETKQAPFLMRSDSSLESPPTEPPAQLQKQGSAQSLNSLNFIKPSTMTLRAQKHATSKAVGEIHRLLKREGDHIEKLSTCVTEDILEGVKTLVSERFKILEEAVRGLEQSVNGRLNCLEGSFDALGNEPRVDSRIAATVTSERVLEERPSPCEPICSLRAGACAAEQVGRPVSREVSSTVLR